MKIRLVRQVSSTQGMLTLMLFLQLIGRGVTLQDSLELTTVFLAQTFTGAIIWKKLIKNQNTNSIELAAMGFAIGSIIWTIIDQILIGFGKHLNYPLIVFSLSVLLLFAYVKSPRINLAKTQDHSNYFYVIAITLSVFLGFGEITHGSLFAILLLTLVLACNRIWIFKRTRTLIATFLSICGSASLLYLYKPPINYGSWFLRPLYTGTDDAIFSESMSYSIATFGSSENAAAIGTSIRYHWFSLAWSGMVDRITDSPPFTMTLHAVPVISFVMISALLFAIGKRLEFAPFVMIVAPLVLFASSTSPQAIRFFYVINTSNILPFVWMLAMVLIIINFLYSTIHLPVPLIVLFIAVIFLSKMPYAVAPTAGLLCVLVYNLRKPTRNTRVTLLFVSVIFLTLFSIFRLYLSPHPWEKRNYHFDWNLMHIANDSKFHLLIAPILLVILLFTRFPFIFAWREVEKYQSIIVFLSGACVTGILRFLLSGSSAEVYFLNSALVFGSLGVAIAISSFLVNPPQQVWLHLAMTSLTSFIASLLLGLLFQEVVPTSINIQFGLMQILFPLLIAVVSSLIAFIRMRTNPVRKSRAYIGLTIIVSLSFANAGVFVLQASKLPPYVNQNLAKEEDLIALKWLRKNSQSSDIVATNRGMCRNVENCKFDDSSFLISAAAHRQVYIEGPRFVTGGRPYPEWVNARIRTSLEFAEFPSQSAVLSLTDLGIDWYFLDITSAPTTPSVQPSQLGEWASLRFHYGNIYIYKL